MVVFSDKQVMTKNKPLSSCLYREAQQGASSQTIASSHLVMLAHMCIILCMTDRMMRGKVANVQVLNRNYMFSSGCRHIHTNPLLLLLMKKDKSVHVTIINDTCYLGGGRGKHVRL